MAAMIDAPTPDDALNRLHNAGWSVGDVAHTGGWLVTGANGENQIPAFGPTQAGAWRLACEQAAAVWMLGPAEVGAW